MVGFKKYLFKSFVDGYSVLSLQRGYGMSSLGESGISTPAISMGLEKNIWKGFFINVGVNSIITEGFIDGIQLVTFPNINLNLRI